MDKDLEFDWIKNHCVYYGFDCYGFLVYRYGELYILVDPETYEIITIEVKKKKKEGIK